MAPTHNSLCLFAVDPAAAADWFCENLFFRRETAPIPGCASIQNGNFRLELYPRDAESLRAAVANASPFGFAHVALRCADIKKAIEYCKSRGMTLDLLDGSYYFNPSLWDQGAYYFNILTPFGYKIEICERLKPSAEIRGLVDGLCHFGMCVDDFDACISFFDSLGFSEDYHEIRNTVNTNNIRCKTVARGDFVFEVFSHSEPSYATAENKGYLKAFELDNNGVCREETAPTGETFLLV